MSSRIGSAAGASETGTDSTSQNGCWMRGTSASTLISAAPHNSTCKPRGRAWPRPTPDSHPHHPLIPRRNSWLLRLQYLADDSQRQQPRAWYKSLHPPPYSGQCHRGRSPPDSNRTRPQSELCNTPSDLLPAWESSSRFFTPSSPMPFWLLRQTPDTSASFAPQTAGVLKSI